LWQLASLSWVLGCTFFFRTQGVWARLRAVVLRRLPFAHHRAALRPRTTESGLQTRGNDDFFNDIRQEQNLSACLLLDGRQVLLFAPYCRT
jgi:hypothetical protein